MSNRRNYHLTESDTQVEVGQRSDSNHLKKSPQIIKIRAGDQQQQICGCLTWRERERRRVEREWSAGREGAGRRRAAGGHWVDRDLQHGGSGGGGRSSTTTTLLLLSPVSYTPPLPIYIYRLVVGGWPVVSFYFYGSTRSSALRLGLAGNGRKL